MASRKGILMLVRSEIRRRKGMMRSQLKIEGKLCEGGVEAKERKRLVLDAVNLLYSTRMYFTII